MPAVSPISLPPSVEGWRTALAGQYGMDYLTTPDTYIGKWCWLRIIGATVLNLTLLDSVNAGSTGDITYADGTVLYGRYTSIGLVSGAVFAYREEPIVNCPTVKGEHARELPGLFGVDYFTNTTDYTGDWCRVDLLTSCTFSHLTSSTFSLNEATRPSDFTSTIVATSILGRFSRIQLASGQLIAYRSAP